MTKMLMGAIDAAVCSASVLLGTAGTTVQAEPLAVIELFTSQGCSSCPAADKLLSELKSDPSLITLSLPIDYWDYLGWKDTLASPGHTARQKAYSRMRGDREVYTPQVVVNGVSQALGSNRERDRKAVTQSRETARRFVGAGPAGVRRENRVTVTRAQGERRGVRRRGLAVSGEPVGAGRHRPRRKPRAHHHLYQCGAALDQARRLDRARARASACRSTPSSRPASMPWPSSCRAAAPTSPARCSAPRSPRCTDIPALDCLSSAATVPRRGLRGL